jgi:proteic killer suppression protein
VIKSFRDKWLEEFYLIDRRHRKIPADIAGRLFRKLQILDDAVDQRDLYSVPGNHFEALQGRLMGKYSIRVNVQWRLVFGWESPGGFAVNVYLDDHSYR